MNTPSPAVSDAVVPEHAVAGAAAHRSHDAHRLPDARRRRIRRHGPLLRAHPSTELLRQARRSPQVRTGSIARDRCVLRLLPQVRAASLATIACRVTRSRQVSSGQEEPSSCINNQTEISLKEFLN